MSGNHSSSNSASCAATNLGSMYAEHSSWLRSWLYKKLGCSSQAADIAQDAFVRLLQVREKEGALPEIQQPRAYLTRVAGRLVHDHFRRQSLERAYLEALAQIPEDLACSELDRLLLRDALEELDRMLDSLKPAVKSAFLLSQLEGLTYAQIGERLSVTERSVKRYMAQAFEHCLLTISL
ncbi:sigma-70 family RNA polymerase sigma factor [Marinobacterium lutimaris]|uniref:RNA polymerase sigma-70 factor, ECF subfamily n=1 Tax=Marinobacterium lutimaris TaxID=568106 RepID=A0A1H6DHV9_9GAMM|nr:sigma-70 family RNA polymerase sigma factor [Marinobacterium lutimaris]SEG84888.1 RNA polymerase sigma-70 factor, ECF subfamily [Marinobacterium lutimaris]